MFLDPRGVVTLKLGDPTSSEPPLPSARTLPSGTILAP